MTWKYASRLLYDKKVLTTHLGLMKAMSSSTLTGEVLLYRHIVCIETPAYGIMRMISGLVCGHVGTDYVAVEV